MIAYIVFLVIVILAWIIITVGLTMEAFDEAKRTTTSYRPFDPQKAKYARIAWLSFFLIPLYPAVVVVICVAGPIYVFRRLGRINEENK